MALLYIMWQERGNVVYLGLWFHVRQFCVFILVLLLIIHITLFNL